MKDYPEFFSCKLCKQYRPIAELVEVTLKDLIFPANFCKACVEKIKNPGDSNAQGASPDTKK